MMKTLILTTLVIACTNAIEPAKIEIADGEIRDVVLKHIKNVPDIENEYVINSKLSNAISRMFKGKLSMLPLYKISLKIDRNPIKIPWTLQQPDVDENVKISQATEKK